MRRPRIIDFSRFILKYIFNWRFWIAEITKKSRIYKKMIDFALFKDDEIYSDWCKRVAIEDFEFGVDGYKKGLYTLRWGPSIDSVVCSEIVLL